jgi:toxin-antitoxin system PIN domain toxin
LIIPDVNLLVYAYNTDAPFHPQARRWWEACVAGSQPVGIPWAVALGYLRLMTNARVHPRPLTMAVALGHLRLWLEQPSVLILQPGPRHLGILTGFCEAGTLSAPLLTDAHIAALAIENQAIVHSNDSDFSRFAGLRWINPLASPPKRAQ